MLTVYSDDHRLQDGKAELEGGKLVPCYEMPRRADLVLARVREVGLGEVVEPERFGVEPILRVHEAGFVAFLQSAWDRWTATKRTFDALPFTWAVRGMRTDRVPESIDGQLAYYSFDAGTPITAGTWRAASSAVDVALTGQRRVAAGARAVFSLCRPPGHHAAAGYYGGYCFLNNAAIAAQAFRDGGAAKVAILDVDYHHGNGSQSIFYRRGDVFFASLHGHPLDEYPFFLGYEDETGEGPGEGANANFPLRWGTGFDLWGQALDEACRRIERWGADALVVSLGVDTYKDDPISRFRLEQGDYPAIGRRIAALGLPTHFVMEGGYAVEEIGINAVGVLTGFEEAA
ncbi:Acetoin utilization deacetylase AcuC [Tistlia consotensis]|uniref:Acetoin utilization deacetylase AcuC n=1 Tax=Tistlia consotensis USBA 355 TaxID=560819 RepID=A0A1Y6B4V8_9PROT|nr:histone deacetylase family protein [Tistlia consotensis]SME89525.1 Acetoin utilization deacetylase AcuC [Tistlia consotensis USBA 355]SNR26039.1 Acetoin utilization deacetylase AcuC [Tistlia consotensis]